MIRLIAALGTGIIFGLGLAISQMVNPAKVLAFLDIASGWLPAGGGWDPSLALVLAGALAVTMVGYRLAFSRQGPLLGGRYEMPGNSAVDLPLIAGAAIFGVGWGLVGLCPGPAFASLAFAMPQSVVFVIAMAAGAALQRATNHLLSRHHSG